MHWQVDHAAAPGTGAYHHINRPLACAPIGLRAHWLARSKPCKLLSGTQHPPANGRLALVVEDDLGNILHQANAQLHEGQEVEPVEKAEVPAQDG